MLDMGNVQRKYRTCTEKYGKGRDTWHPMSPLEILAIQNQTNLLQLEKDTDILSSEITKGEHRMALNKC